ncbi:MAG TPA: nicotinate-nucleotide--dimethylbenzimidazole phosphoribosyltransferase [Magnetospirillaceae bacterium]
MTVTPSAASTIASLADLRPILRSLPGPDEAALAKWQAREPQLTKPAGSLGRLEEITRHLSMWQGRHPPRLEVMRACVFAGNHGVAALGVSAFPAAVTAQMVANFQHGGAAINQLCRANGVALSVDAFDLEEATADFTRGPAMSDGDCAAAFARGMASVLPGTDLLVVGEMGIANTTSAAAICHALFGDSAGDWTGRGTGVDDDHLRIKIEVVEKGVATNASDDPLEVLRRLGGREIAAMAGAILAARLARIPVILDGFVCGAAAAVLYRAAPGALDHCLAGHASAESGHRRLLERMALRPLLDLGMRLGEASGAALAVGLVRAALACHTGMATFTQAGVSDKN